MHRFIGDFDLSQSIVTLTDKTIVHQLRNVLRAEVGNVIHLCDGNRTEANATITDLTRKQVRVSIDSVFKNTNEPERHVTLYCAILKRSNFELVVQKATETGISEIVPLVTKRTVKQNIKSSRLKKIIHEAAEQSGRGIVPALKKPIAFNAIQKTATNAANVFLHTEQADKPPTIFPNSSALNIFIGPEGGWDESEILFAKSCGFQSATLGKLTLRAETAAIVASYLAVHS